MLGSFQSLLRGKGYQSSSSSSKDNTIVEIDDDDADDDFIDDDDDNNGDTNGDNNGDNNGIIHQLGEDAKAIKDLRISATKKSYENHNNHFKKWLLDKHNDLI